MMYFYLNNRKENIPIIYLITTNIAFSNIQYECMDCMGNFSEEKYIRRVSVVRILHQGVYSIKRHSRMN
jgi:hypothetical protein